MSETTLNIKVVIAFERIKRGKARTILQIIFENLSCMPLTDTMLEKHVAESLHEREGTKD